jgi:purine nucleosidase
VRRKLLIDTDTASDDAVALIMALRSPEVEVVAITIVAGNVDTRQGSLNARYVVELCGASVPVHEGALRPLIREPRRATFFHGEDGLGDQHYPAPRTPAARGHAVPALVEAIRSSPGLTLVTLGPLTNVALAIAQTPDIVGLVGRCVVMGGAACTVGNMTPAAEYNVWCDPEAARICFRSGLPIEMVGWELCRGPANLDEEDVARCRAMDTPLSRFTVDCNAQALRANRERFGEPGIPLPDPVAMAVALDPTICTRRSRHRVDVECEGALTRGMTVVDQLDVVSGGGGSAEGWPPALPGVVVCWEIDVARWKALLFRSLHGGGFAPPREPE